MGAGGAEEAAVALVADWATRGERWPAQLARPKLKLPNVRTFLAQSRSAQARGWLQLQRDIHTAAPDRRNSVFGSAYGPSWAARPTPVSTPADHVTPVRWYEGSKLLSESNDPAQVPAVVLCRLEENSAKGDESLGLFGASGEVPRAGQGVYSPTGVSVEKRQLLSRYVAWMWLLYPLIRDKKRSVGIGAYSRSTGCALYGRAWDSGVFKQLARSQPSGYERRVQLLSFAMTRWQVGCPLTFDPSLLDADGEALLEARFKGLDAIPSLVDAALQASVAAAPK